MNLLALALALGGTTPPNVLVVLYDDVGYDMLGNACTPEIDAFHTAGLEFSAAYVSPVCSPTRARMLTGKRGYRTGIGVPVSQNGLNASLPTTEAILPEVWPGDSGIVGKWHLAHPVSDDADHPTDSGFDWFYGHIGNLGWPPYDSQLPCSTPGGGYFDWVKVENGVETCETDYATTVTVDDALAGIDRMDEPWLLWCAPMAVHAPPNCPPGGLLDCESCGGPGDVAQEAMLEALDTELGRLFDTVNWSDTWVFLVSDNGTSQSVYSDPHAKKTVYEPGINVPFAVRGPGICTGSTDALIEAQDVFATIIDLADGTATTDDAISFLPILDGTASAIRSYAYSEWFEPNGPVEDADEWHRAVRDDDGHKLIRRWPNGFGGSETEELYDLSADPGEATPLPLSGSEYNALAAFLDAIETEAL